MIQFTHIAALVLIAQPGPDPATYYANVNAAGRDLRVQLDLTARAIATIPGRKHRGFGKELTRIAIDLATFRELASKKAARDDLLVAFTPVDREVAELLDEMQPFSKWEPAVGLALRRTQSALNDLDMALAAGNFKPERRVRLQQRQIQTLLNREADLESMINIVFFETSALKSWTADLDTLRKATEELERLGKAQANYEELKKQYVKAGEIWEALVDRFKALSPEQRLMLREDFGQVDRVFAGMGPLFDIKGRRAPLPWQFEP